MDPITRAHEASLVPPQGCDCGEICNCAEWIEAAEVFAENRAYDERKEAA